jgi:hypothetical protein
MCAWWDLDDDRADALHREWGVTGGMRKGENFNRMAFKDRRKS